MSASRELADLVSESPSTDLNLDNNTLFVDVSENRVGIGTTAPAYQVDIQDSGTLGTQLRIETTNDAPAGIRLESSNAGSSQIYFGDQADNDVGRLIYNHASDYLAINVNAAERMRIDSAGNVGIGVTPESVDTNYRALQVAGTAGLQGTASQAAGSIVALTNNVYRATDQTWKYIVADEASRYDQFDGSHVFRVAGSGSADATISFSDAMTITNSGKVGIGTSSPVFFTQFVGAGTQGSGTIGGVLQLQDTAAYNATQYNGISFAGKYHSNGAVADFCSILGVKENATDGNYASALTFHTRANGGNGTEKMRIDSAGNVGIGTSSLDSSAFVHMATQSQNKNLIIEEDHDGNSNSGLIIQKKHSTLHPADYYYGHILFKGWDGDQYRQAASIVCVAEGTPANDQMPGNLRFNVNNDTTGPTEAMRIAKNGNVGIGTSSPVGDFQIGSNGIMTHFFSGTISASGSVTHTMTQNSTGGPFYGSFMYTGFIFFQGWTNGAQNNGNRAEVRAFAIAQSSFSVATTPLITTTAGSYGGHSFSTATTNGNPALAINNSSGSYALEYKLTWMFGTQGYTPSSWA